MFHVMYQYFPSRIGFSAVYLDEIQDQVEAIRGPFSPVLDIGFSFVHGLQIALSQAICRKRKHGFTSVFHRITTTYGGNHTLPEAETVSLQGQRTWCWSKCHEQAIAPCSRPAPHLASLLLTSHAECAIVQTNCLYLIVFPTLVLSRQTCFLLLSP